MLILPTVPALLGLLVYGAGASPVVVERNLVPACSAAFRALGVGATSICVRLVGPIQTKTTIRSTVTTIPTTASTTASTTLLPAIVYALSLKKVSRSMKLKERCSTQSATLIAPTTTVQVNSATATSVQSTTVTTVRAYTVTTVTSSTSVSTDVESATTKPTVTVTVTSTDGMRVRRTAAPVVGAARFRLPPVFSLFASSVISEVCHTFVLRTPTVTQTSTTTAIRIAGTSTLTSTSTPLPNTLSVTSTSVPVVTSQTTATSTLISTQTTTLSQSSASTETDLSVTLTATTTTKTSTVSPPATATATKCVEPANRQLITNGGFESGLSPWTVTFEIDGTSSGSNYAVRGPGYNSNNALYVSNVNDGSYPYQYGDVTQMITTCVGGTYQVSGYAYQTSGDDEGYVYIITADNDNVYQQQAASGWSQIGGSFTATSPVTTLTFKFISVQYDNANFALDTVSVVAAS